MNYITFFMLPKGLKMYTLKSPVIKAACPPSIVFRMEGRLCWHTLFVHHTTPLHQRPLNLKSSHLNVSRFVCVRGIIHQSALFIKASLHPGGESKCITAGQWLHDEGARPLWSIDNPQTSHLQPGNPSSSPGTGVCSSTALLLLLLLLARSSLSSFSFQSALPPSTT